MKPVAKEGSPYFSWRQGNKTAPLEGEEMHSETQKGIYWKEGVAGGMKI